MAAEYSRPMVLLIHIQKINEFCTHQFLDKQVLAHQSTIEQVVPCSNVFIVSEEVDEKLYPPVFYHGHVICSGLGKLGERVRHLGVVYLHMGILNVSIVLIYRRGRV